MNIADQFWSRRSFFQSLDIYASDQTHYESESSDGFHPEDHHRRHYFQRRVQSIFIPYKLQYPRKVHEQFFYFLLKWC